MKIILPISFTSFIHSIQKVKKTNNAIDITKEELLLPRLEDKLGKPNKEVKK
jgi:hypothetical protein